MYNFKQETSGVSIFYQNKRNSNPKSTLTVKISMMFFIQRKNQWSCFNSKLIHDKVPRSKVKQVNIFV